MRKIAFMLAVLLDLASGGFAVAQAQGGVSDISAVWANDGGDKVLAEERRASGGPAIVPANGVRNTVWDGIGVTLFGARNEVVSFNLVLESIGGASDVSVKFEKLSGPAGATIGSVAASGNDVFDYVGRNIELFYVRYLPIKGLSKLSYELNDERWIPSKMRRPFSVVSYGTTWNTAVPADKEGWADRPGADKRFPEIAVPLELQPPFNIAPGLSQSVWCDIYIPKDAGPGDYRGTITVSERVGQQRNIPVTLTVRKFTLPDTPTAKAIVAIGDYDISERFLGLEHRFADLGSADYRRLLPILRRYWQMLHRHLVIPIGDASHGIAPPTPEAVSRLDGTLYSLANRYDGPGRDTGDSVYVIGPYGSWAWQTAEPDEFSNRADAWMSWFSANAPSVQKFLYLIDEPSPSDATLMRKINGWLDNLQATPGPGKELPTFITMPVTAVREKAPRVNISANWYSVADTEPYQRAVDAHLTAEPGNQLWQYNGKRPASGSFAIEDDGVSLRVVEWAAFKKGVAGWFYWNASYYYDYQNGAGRTNVWRQGKTFGAPPVRDAANGETSNLYSNGDGVLLYPGVDRLFADSGAPGFDGPVASLRLKHWRRGIQDYEYLTMAKAKDPARTKMIVDTMVPKVLWETGIYNKADPTYQFGGEGRGIGWSENPDEWERARRELADIIEGK